MGGQKYFRGVCGGGGGGGGEQTHVLEYTKYNKINNKSENFRGEKLLLRDFAPGFP